jgi:parallel beta-helix repeat protein
VNHKVIYFGFFPGDLWSYCKLGLLSISLCAGMLKAATYTVTSSADTLTPGTLRYAITQANTNQNADIINFTFTTPTRITATGSLPTVRAPVTIYGSNALFKGTPFIEISGTGVAGVVNGLRIATNNCILNGLRFADWLGSGLQLYYASNTVLMNCESVSNGQAGVQIYESPNSTVGGTNWLACLFGGNTQFGLHLTGTRTTNNAILGNWIGVRRGGIQMMANMQSGILIEGQACANRIGSTQGSERNIIAANGGAGVQIQQSGTSNNWVIGNYIGVDSTGTNALRNSYGVYVLNADGNFIGTTNGGGNVMAANYSAVYLSGAAGNIICANYLGVDASGNRVLTNRDSTVQIDGATANTIGGTSTNDRNVIAGGSHGILITGLNPDQNIIRANYIGLNAAGNLMLSNRLFGIRVDTGTHTQIGGNSPGAGNVISGNGSGGIWISAPASDTLITGNFIGTDAQVLWPLGNGGAGIFTLAPRTMIGTAHIDGIGRNVICANDGGITISGTQAIQCVVQGNFIGVDRFGSAVLSNRLHGIAVQGGGFSNTLGGIDSPVNRAGNVICGSAFNGILIAASDNTTIQGNSVGIDDSGWIGPGNGSSAYAAIRVENSQGTLIGGAFTGYRNLIGGSSGIGIDLQHCSQTEISGNFIGIGTNQMVVPNVAEGIKISECSSTRIGGSSSNAQNIIGGNNNGIYLTRSTDTEIENNAIGISARSTVISNRSHGISIENITGCLVQSNTISGNQMAGISLVAATGCVITANTIGTTLNRSQALANLGPGIKIDWQSFSNRIGAPLLGNLISGNAQEGLWIQGSRTTIEGNTIGLNAGGQDPVPNGSGLLLWAVEKCQVGGLNPGQANLISGNWGSGLSLLNCRSNSIYGNRVGTDLSGLRRLGNGENGIFISSSDSNSFGSVASPGSNTIAFNTLVGILVNSGVGNSLLGNAVYENQGFEIDLGASMGWPNGHTPNDMLDGDGGPNDLQNHPILTWATNNGTQITIEGSLNSTPSTPVWIEFYGSRGPHPKGYGGADTRLGAINGITDGSGNFAFTAVVPSPPIPPNTVSALAHNSLRSNTSEFSPYLLLDSDGDGMGDGFEFFFTGLLNGLEPDRDDDEDGATHLEEFLADTDPTDEDSYPQITETRYNPSNNRMEIAYPRTGRRVYSIVTSYTLNPPWTPLNEEDYAASGIVTSSVPVTANIQYFGLNIKLP